jgi:hypothetical protein
MLGILVLSPPNTMLAIEDLNLVTMKFFYVKLTFI